MKSVFFITFLALSLQTSWATEIGEKHLKPEGSEESQTQLFIKYRGAETPLPIHTTYVSRIFNANKTLWAINFHETSNDDDVDLIICKNGKPTVIKSLFDRLEPILIEQKILPKVNWDHQYLAVKKIRDNLLSCHFYGASHAKQMTLEKDFTISIAFLSGKAHFTVVSPS
jgi:hypothetical protein